MKIGYIPIASKFMKINKRTSKIIPCRCYAIPVPQSSLSVLFKKKTFISSFFQIILQIIPVTTNNLNRPNPANLIITHTIADEIGDLIISYQPKKVLVPTAFLLKS